MDFSALIEQSTRDFTGREWVFEEIDRWLADPDAPRYFIITGEPGIGKTAIAARLTQFSNGSVRSSTSTSLDQGFLSAVHFCVGGRGSTTEPSRFIESLAEQLSECISGFGRALLETQQAFTDRSVVITPVQIIHSMEGGQATSVSIQHLEIRGLPPEAAFDRLVRHPLQVMSKKGELSQITILIDALDEAVAHVSHPNIVEILTQAQDLPAHVRFILTSRPDPNVLTSFADLPHLTIEAKSPENQEDVAHYLARILQTDEHLQNALVSAGRDGARFVNELGEISEWNFLYLSLMLRDISADRLSPEKIALPRSLDVYYKYLLSTRLGLEEWTRWGADLMEVLLALQEPGSLEQIAAYLEWPKREAHQRLMKVRQLLDPGLWDQGQYWRYHWSVVDFLTNRERSEEFWCNRRQGHVSIADFYLGAWDGLEAELQGPRRLKKPILHGGYGFRHVTKHLVAAGMIVELGTLVERRAWYDVQRIYDPSLRLYATGIEQALKAVEQQAADGLPRVVAWSLLYGTVGVMAAAVPLDALETMILLGEEEQALSHAALVQDPEQQAHAYQRIAFQLLTRGQTSQAQAVLDRAIGAAEGISYKATRVRVLNEIAITLSDMGLRDKSEEILKTAWAVAHQVRDDSPVDSRTEVLAETAHTLARSGRQAEAREMVGRVLTAVEDLKSEATVARVLDRVAGTCTGMTDLKGIERALSVAERIQDEYFRVSTLSELAEAFAQVGDSEGSQHAMSLALNTVDRIASTGYRSGAVANVARVMAQMGQLGRAMALVESIEGSDSHSWALAGIVSALAHTGDFDRAISLTDGIRVSSEQANALASVARALAQAGHSERALAVATAIRSEAERANTLVELSRIAGRAGEFDHALETAERIRHTDKRASAFASVALALSQAGDGGRSWEVLSEALMLVEEVNRQDLANSSIIGLIDLVGAVAGAGKLEEVREALSYALAVAKGVSDPGQHDQVLVGVASVLIRAGDLDHALMVSEDIKDGARRARSQTRIAQAMARAGDREGARGVLALVHTTARNIQNEVERAQTLAGMAEALVITGDLAYAVELTEEIDESTYGCRAMALVGIANALAGSGQLDKLPELSVRAIEAVEKVKTPYARIEALIEVSQILASVGDLKSLTRAVELAERIRDEEDGYLALEGVACALAELEDSKGIARVLVAANDVRDEGRRRWALSGVARAWARSGDLDHALRIVNSLQDEDVCDDILVSMAEFLAGLECLGRALALIDYIRDEDNRAVALVGAAQALAQAGRVQDARRVLPIALEMARNIQEDVWPHRAECLAEVARSLILTGDIHSALLVAEGVDNQRQRIEAVDAVAQALGDETRSSDREAVQSVVEAFRIARSRGREEVLQHIRAFTPVLERLRVLMPTWERVWAAGALFRMPHEARSSESC